MTNHEIKLINSAIESYKRMIKHLNEQICILESKKIDKCCFEKSKVKKFKTIKVKNDKETKRYTGKRPPEN